MIMNAFQSLTIYSHTTPPLSTATLGLEQETADQGIPSEWLKDDKSHRVILSK